MSLRSLVSVGGILVICAFLLAGCGGSGSGGTSPIQGGGTLVTFTNITSVDGNAQLGDPSPGGVPANQVTVFPTVPNPYDPNMIPGTVYTISGLPIFQAPGVNGPLPFIYKLTLKYDPSTLPAGVTPNQLIIVKGVGSPTEGFLSSDVNATVDTSTKTVTTMVNGSDTYGLAVSVPVAGKLISGHLTGTTQGIPSFNIDPSGFFSTTATVNGIANDGGGFTTYQGETQFQIGPASQGVASNFSGLFQGTIQKNGNVITGSGTWADSTTALGTWSIP